MFMGYSVSQWIGVIEWFILMIILFAGIFITSCIVVNKTLHKRRKNKIKKAEKKSYFIDVA
jgi:hypothetical protein